MIIALKCLFQEHVSWNPPEHYQVKQDYDADVSVARLSSLRLIVYQDVSSLVRNGLVAAVVVVDISIVARDEFTLLNFERSVRLRSEVERLVSSQSG